MRTQEAIHKDKCRIICRAEKLKIGKYRNVELDCAFPKYNNTYSNGVLRPFTGTLDPWDGNAIIMGWSDEKEGAEYLGVLQISLYNYDYTGVRNFLDNTKTLSWLFFKPFKGVDLEHDDRRVLDVFEELVSDWLNNRCECLKT